jgi:dTDP-3-amino-2,3,6-trideoxy-4-keto-D-glucose/dTDP-3-amino-3,4,6-trideoxy-alpha-D-glucose/dTDP-2,6-dideoxy-D-kanosamine transaminase
MKKVIKVWDYLEEYESDRIGILEAVDSVFRSGQLILGESVINFENEFSKYCNVSHGVGLDNATNAIALSIRSLDIQHGDEIITVANTAVPTVSAIIQAGCKPVFVDVVYESGLMDTNKIIEKISSKTKCIIPVHLFGQCVDMDNITKIAKDYSLKVIEDCSQAHGATYKNQKAGSMGDIGIFSFYPTKILGAYGDGGIAVTDSIDLANRLKRLRFYGMEQKYYAVEHGFNSRLDEVQARILSYKLKQLDEKIAKRRQIAKKYDSELRGSPFEIPHIASNNSHSYYLYVLKHHKRDEIISALRKQGVNLSISYPYPIHLMKAYESLDYKNGDLPITEELANKIFSIPMYPSLSDNEQSYVVQSLLRSIN